MDLREEFSKRRRRLGNVLRTVAARAGLDHEYSKIFLIGFNKTATSSMHRLFTDAGIASFHNPKWIKPENRWLLYRHRAFADGAPLDFDRLDRMFPRSKFILNLRDLDEWIDSRLVFVRRQIDEGLIAPSRHWTDTPEAVDHWIATRNRHHLAVLRYFRERPGDLLILNYIRDGHAVGKLAAFTGLPLAAKKVHVQPRSVKLRQRGVLTKREMIHARLRALGVAEAEYGYDIFCPSLVTDGSAEGLPADTSHLAGSVFAQAVSPGR